MKNAKVVGLVTAGALLLPAGGAMGQAPYYPPTPTPTPTPKPTPTPTPTPTPKPFTRLSPKSLSIKSSCKLRNGKVRCTTSGTLSPNAALKKAFGNKACSGKVRIAYKSGSRTISSRNVTVKSCKYRSSVTFSLTRRLRNGLKVKARYAGNSVSKPKNSRTVTRLLRKATR